MMKMPGYNTCELCDKEVPIDDLGMCYGDLIVCLRCQKESEGMSECGAKLKDIREHPELHRHDFGELQVCCMVGGALDLSLMEAHSRYANLGTNGGQSCDVVSGPCSCGAWH